MKVCVVSLNRLQVELGRDANGSGSVHYLLSTRCIQSLEQAQQLQRQGQGNQTIPWHCSLPNAHTRLRYLILWRAFIHTPRGFSEKGQEVRVPKPHGESIHNMRTLQQ